VVQDIRINDGFAAVQKDGSVYARHTGLPAIPNRRVIVRQIADLWEVLPAKCGWNTTQRLRTTGHLERAAS